MTLGTLFPPDPFWMTVTDSARYCGVSKTTFYKWIDQGLVPIHTGPTGVRRISRDDLDALYAEGNADA